MTVDRKYLLLIVGSLSLWLCCLIGVYVFYYQPQFTKAQVLVAQEQSLNKQVAEAGDYTTMLHKLQLNEAKVNKYLPQSINLPSFLQEVNKMAKEAGVEILDLHPEEEKQEEKYKSQGIIIQVQGNFWQILNFLKKIHSYPLLINVNSGQITSSNDIIKSTLGIKLFALPK